ncbi:MAG: hypothetical protein E7480_03670 [Ruminococcaceae bacterium]|nr:hypothetical protein [Oscillospiraceae bacterium]
MLKIHNKIITLILITLLLITSCASPSPEQSSSALNDSSAIQSQVESESSQNQSAVQSEASSSSSYENLENTEALPVYNGSPYIAINNNIPSFTNEEKKQTSSFENYSQLDSLGRCGVTYACIGKDLMPTEERGNIGNIKPTGWQTVKYDFVDGKYLYNRCHLIGFQLTAENDNIKNLITGTRYLNIRAMLPFENMVADYIKETNNHVLYRVTPIFNKNELVARGVQMEAWSVEDNGDGICFNIYCFNVQPGVEIDYSTGKSKASESTSATTSSNSSAISSNSSSSSNPVTKNFVLNTNTKKFHYPSCRHVSSIKAENYSTFSGTRDNIIKQGYSPCSVCKP